MPMLRLAAGVLGLTILLAGATFPRCADAATFNPLAALRESEDLGELPADVPGRLIDVGGRRVHIVERGAGPPLLLVHGFGASTDDFEEFVLEPLSRSYRTIAVDLYGFGWSERNDAFQYGWPLWSDQLAGTLDVLGIERASVAGHSMGGAVAAYFAAHHPDRVDRLILVDAFYPLQPDEVPWIFRGLRTPVVGEIMLGAVTDGSAPGYSDAHHARAVEWYRIRGTRAAMLAYVRDPNRLPLLTAGYPQITAPTLVLHGEQDQNIPYAAMQRTVPAIRNAKVVTLSGGHFPLRDDPTVFVREVQQFLPTP